MLKGFKEFIMKGNVVDLAVAVVIGGAFGLIVKSLVTDIITPAIGAIVGTPDFSSIMVGPLKMGNFLNAVIGFLFVALAIYFFVVAPMNRMKKKDEEPEAPAEPSDEVKLLQEIRDALQK